MLLPLDADDGADRGVGFDGVRLTGRDGVALLATRIVSAAFSSSLAFGAEPFVGCACDFCFFSVEYARGGLSGIVSSFLRFADRGDSILVVTCLLFHVLLSSLELLLMLARTLHCSSRGTRTSFPPTPFHITLTFTRS